MSDDTLTTVRAGQPNRGPQIVFELPSGAMRKPRRFRWMYWDEALALRNGDFVWRATNGGTEAHGAVLSADPWLRELWNQDRRMVELWSGESRLRESVEITRHPTADSAAPLLVEVK